MWVICRNLKKIWLSKQKKLILTDFNFNRKTDFKNLCFQKKIDISALFEPIFMKGGVADITKTYPKNFFRIFGAQFEVLDRKK